jgi:hypothetical protein
VIATTLTGCLEERKLSDTAASLVSGSPPTSGLTGNSAPTISGKPSTTAQVNQAYAFQPAASDPDGDRLAFQIANKPAWAAFDAATGRLSGTPSSSASGVFADIRITVSDGKLTTALAPFSITVASGQLGSATLSWQPPTENTDGSALTNLAGYIVRYGTSADSLPSEVRITNPGVTTYVVGDLAPATWHFQVSAFNTSGVESAPSTTASKTIS